MEANMPLTDRERLSPKRLVENPYPGRGVGIGCFPNGEAYLQFCWMMGRREETRNRVYLENGGDLRTAIADPGKLVSDASLTIYRAMAEAGDVYVVSNGHQTDTVLENLSRPL